MLLLELSEGLVDLVEGSHLVQGQTHYAGLLGQGLEYALTYPPHCVGDEFETTGFIEFFRSLDETQIAFVDQIRKAKPLILILFRNRYHESEISPREFFQCYLVALADALCQFYFLFR